MSIVPTHFRDILHIADRQAELSWQPFRPGVEIYPLYGFTNGNPDGGSAAALLRYQPGASVPRHRHRGYEHIWVLSGSQSDDRGTYETGDFAVNPPDSHHSVWSDMGCIVLIVWEKPVELCQ